MPLPCLRRPWSTRGDISPIAADVRGAIMALVRDERREVVGVAIALVAVMVVVAVLELLFIIIVNV